MIALQDCGRSRGLKAHVVTGPQCCGKTNTAEQIRELISSYGRSTHALCESLRGVGSRGNANEDERWGGKA